MNTRGGIPSPRVFWLIHFAFVGMVPIYWVIAHFVIGPQIKAGQWQTALPYPQPMINAGLLILATMNAALGYILPGMIRPRGAPGVDIAEAVVRILLTRLIVMDACLEAVAVFGLVGLIVGASLWVTDLLIFASLVLLAAQVGQIASWFGGSGG
jgi:hypothetical protein